MTSVRPVPHSMGCVPEVREFMSPSPVVLHHEALVSEARHTMRERRIRHLPIVSDGGDLVGLVTERDLLVLGHGMDARRVGELMQSEVEAVGPGCCVGAAARFMLRSKKGCLPVVDEAGRLLGILTEADFLRAFVRESATCTCEPSHYLGGLAELAESPSH